ncbi:TonB-dependent siderophore receptor [Pseudomonas sp. LRF_L74]|uniref:TonB-dependent siderophore receptor n=1 Tax=Pseudomonas sp. LRF_L74 TaxID=3369422 RepID=UPI003F600FE6
MPHPFTRHRLAAALLSASAIGVPLAHAAGSTASPAAIETTRQYDIAAGSLTEVLSRFASASGVALSFDATQTNGRQSNGLHGSYSVNAGFATLLAGSNLRVIDAGGSYVLEKVVDSGAALELGATSVNANGVRSTTEGSQSYTTGAMQSATKLPLTMRETPQSVTVITRQRMDDQGLKTLQDAVAATPGISLQGSGPQRFGFYSRGFEIGNLMLDGLPTAYSISIGAGLIAGSNMVMYDRIEVVRGATGMMQGAGDPSGSINLVRKRPTSEFQASIKGSAGSWDNYSSELDISGPLNESGSVRGRLVGAYQTKDSFQDYVSSEGSTFYAIGEADLDSATTLTVGASHQINNNNDTWGGLAAVDASGNDLHLSRSTYLGNDWEYWDQDTSNVFAELDHRFDNGWRVKLSGAQQWSELNYLGTYLSRTGDAINVSRGGGYRYDVDQQTYDLFASGPFQMLGREHELVIGSSARSAEMHAVGGSGGTASLDIDPFDWDYSAVAKPVTGLTYRGHTETTQQGLYLTTRLSLADPLKLILGTRLDWYQYDNLRDDSDYSISRNVTRYAGLIYELDAHHSVYASYTDIFQPQSSMDAAGGQLEPVVGTNYEIGVKGEYFDGTLNASLAVFQIDQENRARQLDQALCSTSSACYEASGVVRSRGVDIELQGELTPNWQIGGGFTFVQAEYAKTEGDYRKGQLFDSTLPRQQFKLFTSYQLPGDHLRVGGSVSWQGDTYKEKGDYRFEQNAYAVFGVMAGYRVSEALDLQFNIDNLFDKHYYRNINGTTYPVQVYGAPRNYLLTAKYSF